MQKIRPLQVGMAMVYVSGMRNRNEWFATHLGISTGHPQVVSERPRPRPNKTLTQSPGYGFFRFGVRVAQVSWVRKTRLGRHRGLNIYSDVHTIYLTKSMPTFCKDR